MSTDRNPGRMPVLSRRRVVSLLAGSALAGCGERSGQGSPASDAEAQAGAPPPQRPALGSRLIVGHGAILPGLADEAGRGPMADMMRAIWATRPDLDVRVEFLPVSRVVYTVSQGLVDFSFPDLRLPPPNPPPDGYGWSTGSMGRVCFVLYSNQDNVVTPERIEAELSRPEFQLEIEAPIDIRFGFPTISLNSLDTALLKVAAGRLDALLWAQEEADTVARQLSLGNIRRSMFATYDDVLDLPRDERGREVDAWFTDALARARASGVLERAYRLVHRPFDPWQPAFKPTPAKGGPGPATPDASPQAAGPGAAAGPLGTAAASTRTSFAAATGLDSTA